MNTNYTEIHSIFFSEISIKITNSYAKKKAIAHQEALHKTNEEKRRFIPILEASQRASFEKVAETIGLDGISEDIFAYVSRHTEFSHLNPLITCEDLCTLLVKQRELPDSTVMKAFFEIEHDSPLYSLIHSIDLASDLSLYKHECILVDILPYKLVKNTIYIQLRNQQLLCTVVCPFGNTLSKNYQMNNFTLGYNKIDIKEPHLFLNILQSNSHLLLLDIYYDQKIPNGSLGSFNVFSESLIKVDGFKSHVIKTIRTYNQELKRTNGLSIMPLTKQHLSQSRGNNYCGFEIQPEFQAEHIHHEQTLREINNVYYAEINRLEEECQEAIRQAKIKFEIEKPQGDNPPKETLVTLVPIKKLSSIFQFCASHQIVEKVSITSPSSTPKISTLLSPTTIIKRETAATPILQPKPLKYGLFTHVDPSTDNHWTINEILTMSMDEIREIFFKNTSKNTSSRFIRT